MGIFLYLAINPQYADLTWYFVLVVGGAPLVAKTFRSVLRGRFASDIIAALAIIVAIIVGEAFAGAIIVLMQSGGEALEDYGFKRASSSLKELMERAPKMARRRIGSRIDEIRVDAVKVGDILVIRHGDLIPVDGTVRSGKAYVDESALTGEPLPQAKKKGDKVMSGTVNTSGTFEILTDAISKQSQYAKIVELVEKAQKEKPHIERLADRYAVWFTPFTILISTIGYIITNRVDTVLAVLVVATPCPLIIAVPIAVIAGINKAADNGIIVKSGAAIEQVGNARTVFFDKTGTITVGQPRIGEIKSFGNNSKNAVLGNAACVEQLSAHPLAAAVVDKAKKSGIRIRTPKRFKETPSGGVEGLVDGMHVAVGSKKFIAGIAKPGPGKECEQYADSANAQGRMCLFVAFDHEVAGALSISDEMRPSVRQTLHKLKGLGVEKTIMLTGDNAANAKAISSKAGIDEFRADLLPQDKSRMVSAEMSGDKTIVMVGDGINDAPALATATVGVAMGAHGTAISSEAADVVLLTDDIVGVGRAVEIGKRMSHIAKQSIFVGLGLSICLMIVAGAGFIPPPVGAFLQEVVDVTVILNALRVK